MCYTQVGIGAMCLGYVYVLNTGGIGYVYVLVWVCLCVKHRLT